MWTPIQNSERHSERTGCTYSYSPVRIPDTFTGTRTVGPDKVQPVLKTEIFVNELVAHIHIPQFAYLTLSQVHEL